MLAAQHFYEAAKESYQTALTKVSNEDKNRRVILERIVKMEMIIQDASLGESCRKGGGGG